MLPRSTGPLLSLQRTQSTGKEVACVVEKECVKCEPEHICRNCNIRWNVLESHKSTHEEISKSGSSQKSSFRKKFKSHFHKYRWYYMILLGAIIAIVVALPVVFRPKHPTGIYRKGSGIVAIDRGDQSSVVDFFFQHESGQIRHIVLDEKSQTWTGGTTDNNVLGQSAPIPRLSTPLMAVTWTIGNETTWNVFYVDTDNILQSSVGSSSSAKTGDFPTEWVPGSLGLGKFKANLSPNTGLSVCKSMLWLPDSLGLNNASLVLLYGGEDGLNHMLTHEIQDTAWNYNHTFENSSAESGIECTSRGSSILDTWMINPNGELSQASFNLDPASNNSVYRAGEWTTGIVYNGPIQIPTSISSIRYTGNHSVYDSGSTFVHFTTPRGIVSEINVNTSDRFHLPLLINGPPLIVSNSPIVSQSKIASVALTTGVEDQQTSEHGEDNKVFLQMESVPAQISRWSRNFYDSLSSFTPEQPETSNIQG